MKIMKTKSEKLKKKVRRHDKGDNKKNHTEKGGMVWGVEARFKREGTYVYLWLIHIVVCQKPTQHHKAVIIQL